MAFELVRPLAVQTQKTEVTQYKEKTRERQFNKEIFDYLMLIIRRI